MAPPDTTSSEASYTAVMNENALQGRELEWAVNSEELLAKHAEKNRLSDGKVIVRTRFPPEPNGEIHIRVNVQREIRSLSRVSFTSVFVSNV
jgi:hypothetical protein